MNLNELGQTGIRVSELSFGTLTLASFQADLSLEESNRLLKKALALGINLFDTATSYQTQSRLRAGLGDAVNEVIISTKTHARTSDLVRRDFEASLKDLDREYIDIYHVHLVDGSQDLEDRRCVLDFLLDCKRKGLVRAIGASVHKVSAARAVVAEPDIDVLFTILNSQSFGIIDGTSEDMAEVCRRASARGMGVMAMKPLGGGHLNKIPQKAFDFIRDFGSIDSICVGMQSPAEVEMNVRLFEDRKVSEAILSRLDASPRRLLISRFCTGCGNCIDACAQRALSIDTTEADESIGKEGKSVVDHDTCILCGYCADACPQFAIRII